MEWRCWFRHERPLLFTLQRTLQGLLAQPSTVLWVCRRCGRVVARTTPAKLWS